LKSHSGLGRIFYLSIVTLSDAHSVDKMYWKIKSVSIVFTNSSLNQLMLSPRHGKIAFHRQTKWCSTTSSASIPIMFPYPSQIGQAMVIETKQMDVVLKFRPIKIIGIRKSFVRI
jgi:hypothetical protein